MASGEGPMISCHTVDAWNEVLQKANESKKLVVVDFTASSCGPCRFIAPVLAGMARNMPDVMFVKIDIDELKSVAENCAVEAMPTFVFMKEGKIVDRVEGAKKDELQMAVAKHAAPAAATSPAAIATATSIAIGSATATSTATASPTATTATTTAPAAATGTT